MGRDREFADVSPEEITPEFPAWTLEQAQRTPPDGGRRVESKLARKHPRLAPIHDKVVARVMGLEQTIGSR